MKWKPEYATGIHNIDHQHQEIVGLITLYENMTEAKADWQEVHPLILRTREFMEFHFSVEESLMRLLPYPDCDAHRAEHQRELRQIADIEDRMRHGDMQAGPALLMRHCLLGHIVAGDKRLAQYALSLYGQRAPGKRSNRAAGVAARCE